MRVGLISDSHGLLRPEAVKFLRGADHIIHAGDIGDPAILAALQEIAPLTAVRGNNDTGRWARKVPHSANLELDGVVIHVVHDIADLPMLTDAMLRRGWTEARIRKFMGGNLLRVFREIVH